MLPLIGIFIGKLRLDDCSYVEVDYTPPVVGLESKSANMAAKMVTVGLI